MKFQSLPGMEDVLPSQVPTWQWLEHTFLEVTSRYGYAEIRTPTMEDLKLFTRTAGETSEVVTKQMFEFVDKGNRHVALKPESTAPAVRALVENSLCPPGNTARLCYVSSPHFRYERAQKGRLREHHQFGCELIGVKSVAADAEVLEVIVRFLAEVGLKDTVVLLNSLGRDECRERYREALLGHFEPYLASLSSEAAERGRANPLRLLDTKDEKAAPWIESAPSILDFHEPESRSRFETLQALLTEAGIRYRVSPHIVRGLDYYTETVFEVQSEHLGAQSAVCGGGRYDNLVKELGGPSLPAVGFGMGIERLILILESLGLTIPSPKPDIFVVALGAEGQSWASNLVRGWRDQGLRVELDLDGASLKSQMRQADGSGARFAVVIGEDEVSSRRVTLKEMTSGDQQSMNPDEVAARIG